MVAKDVRNSFAAPNNWIGSVGSVIVKSVGPLCGEADEPIQPLDGQQHIFGAVTCRQRRCLPQSTRSRRHGPIVGLPARSHIPLNGPSTRATHSATWHREPFDDPDWLFDFKYDG